MRPQITIKTSQPFQRYILQENDSDDEMDDLAAFRDRVIDELAGRVEVIDELEARSGLEFQTFGIDAWVYTGRDKAISSPIMLPRRDDPQVAFFELVFLLAKELIFQNQDSLEDHEMLESGFEALDVTAGLIAYTATAAVEDEDFVDDLLDTSVFGGDALKTWRAVKEHAAEMEDGTVLDHLGIDQQNDDQDDVKEIAEKM
ncbi:MAG: hypothetical protein SVU32_00275 [Candidatus Nanohaloarchaea archaeon]|nr:hypothetical protein [Candidatus Nanohaloarchaea archaeon]